MASFKQQIIQMTGMSDAEYRREYTRYAARVRNFNRATGSNVSAAKAFYNSKKYANNLSQLQEAIQATPATRAHRARTESDPHDPVSAHVLKQAESYIYKAWSGAISKSTAVHSLWEEYKRGNITLAEFEKRANQWSKERREKIEKGDPTVGS